MFTFVAVVGILAADLVPASIRYGFVACSGFAVALIDIRSAAGHTYCPVGPARQTPKLLFDKFGPRHAAVLWGLDAGLAATTIRVSAMTWLLFMAVGLHIAPWWIGVTYGLGFTVPLAVATDVRLRFGVLCSSDPIAIVRRLIKSRSRLQFGCALIAVTFAASAVARV